MKGDKKLLNKTLLLGPTLGKYIFILIPLPTPNKYEISS
jgi:hypothetical protein